MISSPRNRPARMLNESLLTTRLITAIGLVFLLLVGGWSATHSERESPSPGAAPVVVALDEQSVAAHGAVTGDTSATAATTGVENLGGSLMGAAAGCLFGLLCCLVLIAFTKLASRRHPSVVPTVSPPSTAPAVTAARLFVPTLTLSQLSISRT